MSEMTSRRPDGHVIQETDTGLHEVTIPGRDPDLPCEMSLEMEGQSFVIR